MLNGATSFYVLPGALIGNVVHVADELTAPSFINQHVALIRPNRSAVLPSTLLTHCIPRLGESSSKQESMAVPSRGSALHDVKSAMIPLPPPAEQATVCGELDAAMHRLAASVDSVQREISLLREYRTRLIADVVTGKLDVREAALLLPDEVQESELPDEAEGETDLDEIASDDLEGVPEEAGA